MSDVKWKMKDHRNCFDLRKDFNLIIMNRNKKISVSQVNILEFFNFYKEISKYQYSYILDNNVKINLIFNESNFSHLLGLHKFKMVLKYKKQ